MEEGRWRFVAASPLRLLVLLVSMRLGTSWNGGVGSGVSYRPLTMRPVQNDGQKICSLRQDPWRHGYCSFPQTSLRHHSEVGTEGVEDMHAFDDAMHAVNQPASMPPQGRESGRNFLYWLATWPTRDLLPETRLPTVSLMLWSALLVYLHSLDKANPFHVEAIGTMPHFVLSGTLGFFLTFRADEGYRRLEEARKVWDGVLNRCRDLIRCGACAGFILGPQGVRRMANLTCAFAMVLEEYVCERASPPDELHELLEPSDIKALERASNSPLTIVELMAQELITLAREDRGGGSLGDSTFFPRFMDSLDGLSHTVTQCERLLKPSVPPVYYGFALRFMSVWLCTLPLALLEENLPAPALIVAQGVITWALFGVWELGVKAQYPFKAGAVNMRNLWKSLIVEAKDSLYVARLQQKEGSSKA